MDKDLIEKCIEAGCKVEGDQLTYKGKEVLSSIEKASRLEIIALEHVISLFLFSKTMSIKPKFYDGGEVPRGGMTQIVKPCEGRVLHPETKGNVEPRKDSKNSITVNVNMKADIDMDSLRKALNGAIKVLR